MNVDGLSQILHGHSRALNVPAWPARADACLPEKLARLGRFPEGEIPRISLVVAIHIHARPGLDAGRIHVSQFAVIWELRYAKVNRAVAHVSKTLRSEPLDELHHILDMVGGPHRVFGLSDA